MFIPELFGAPGPDAHQQVGTPEQDMEPVHVLGNATVCNFPIPEIPFDYEKGVLYLTANRRDTIFHLLFPVDSLIVFGCFQAGGTLTNAVIDWGQVFILMTSSCFGTPRYPESPYTTWSSSRISLVASVESWTLAAVPSIV